MHSGTKPYPILFSFGRLCQERLGTSLSKNEGKGREKVTNRVNSRCFKLHRSYSILFNLSIVGEFFWRTVPKFRERKRKLLSCIHVPKICKYEVSRASRQTKAKKCTKKSCFANRNQFFWPCSLPSPSSLSSRNSAAMVT